MARPAKVVSKLEYFNQCVQGAISLYNSNSSPENLDILHHWTSALSTEVNLLRGAINAPISSSPDQQESVGSQVPQSVKKDGKG